MEEPAAILNKWNNTRDEALFRKLYEAFFHTLLDVASKYVDPETARDMVQNIFLRLWTSPDSFGNVNNLRFYLYRTIKNQCLNHIRDRKVESRYHDGLDIASEDYFSQIVLEEEVFLQIRSSIDRLPEIYMQVLSLSLEGLSDKEVAVRLNISLDNVKTRKKRGKSMLRDTIKNPTLLLVINML